MIYDEEQKPIAHPLLLDDGDDVGFGQGMVDTFQFMLPRVKNISCIRIGHDSLGQDSSWHLDKVRVYDTHFVIAVTDYNSHYTFPNSLYYYHCRRHLDVRIVAS